MTGILVTLPIVGILSDSTFLQGWPSSYYVFGENEYFFFCNNYLLSERKYDQGLLSSLSTCVKNECRFEAQYKENLFLCYQMFFVRIESFSDTKSDKIPILFLHFFGSLKKFL